MCFLTCSCLVLSWWIIGRPPHGVSHQWAVVVHYGMRQALACQADFWRQLGSPAQQQQQGAGLFYNVIQLILHTYEAEHTLISSVRTQRSLFTAVLRSTNHSSVFPESQLTKIKQVIPQKLASNRSNVHSSIRLVLTFSNPKAAVPTSMTLGM